MTFSIDESFLPAILTSHPMTDAEFADLCAEYPDLFFEMTAEGELIVMPPNYTITSSRHRAILVQLDRWAEQDGRGTVTDSSGGFVLPSGARRSPDVAWTLLSRLGENDRAGEDRYWHLCPDFVIEVRSHHDRLRTLRAKMEEWIENGAQLAWLIDPDTRIVEVYRPGLKPETFSNLDVLQGTPPLDGFVLDLARVWNPLSRLR